MEHFAFALILVIASLMQRISFSQSGSADVKIFGAGLLLALKLVYMAYRVKTQGWPQFFRRRRKGKHCCRKAHSCMQIKRTKHDVVYA
ncbi:hypothetical protein AAVH_36396 [Aphelenchoides avenae]|nr:hypothetical protein AAVH_36396 [Aphelenchus avenae]